MFWSDIKHAIDKPSSIWICSSPTTIRESVSYYSSTLALEEHVKILRKCFKIIPFETRIFFFQTSTYHTKNCQTGICNSLVGFPDADKDKTISFTDYVLCSTFKDEIVSDLKTQSVNTICLGYKNGQVIAVNRNNRCLFWDPHQTHKCILGRKQNFWMLKLVEYKKSLRLSNDNPLAY
jgi:hypothetical protein